MRSMSRHQLHDSGCTIVLASSIKASWSRQVIARYIYHPNNIGEYDSGGGQWDDGESVNDWPVVHRPEPRLAGNYSRQLA